MCGIAGFMSFDGTPPAEDVLKTMGEAIRHRGPDGSCILVEREGGIGLVHVRLAIIDLETGDQPIEGPNDTVIAANGEIYNYVELREELRGETFETNSDCEPPLFLYRDFGETFAEQLRGMYAIALFDRQKKRLLLARDPFGIKPLYYAETVKGIAFASEPKALIAAGFVEPKVKEQARNELLQLAIHHRIGLYFRGDSEGASGGNTGVRTRYGHSSPPNQPFGLGRRKGAGGRGSLAPTG